MSAFPVDHAAVGGARVKPASRRRATDRAFLAVCLAVTSIASLLLAILLISIIAQGWQGLSWDFLTSYPSRFAEKAGIKAALWGSVWVCIVCAAVAVPLGVGTAVLLEEYAPRGRITRRLHEFVQLNITNLAGVPSVVYGIIGLTAFARMFGLFGPANLSNYDDITTLTLKNGMVLVGSVTGEDESTVVIDDFRSGEVVAAVGEIKNREASYIRTHAFTLKDGSVVEGRLRGSDAKNIKVFLGPEKGMVPVPRDQIVSHAGKAMVEVGGRERPWYFHIPFGSGVLAAGLTLMLVVLPIVIVATREALRAVPDSLREGAMALGATRWQMIAGMTLPAAIPGIMTGAILAMSRAIGEAAPILVVSGVVFLMNTPDNLMSQFSAMPLQIYNWANMPQDEFKQVAASGIIVLMVVLCCFNLAAILIRQKMQKGLQA
ncbi:MAG: PstA family ABC transporter permease [Phycisphaerales bacterium]